MCPLCPLQISVHCVHCEVAECVHCPLQIPRWTKDVKGPFAAVVVTSRALAVDIMFALLDRIAP